MLRWVGRLLLVPAVVGATLIPAAAESFCFLSSSSSSLQPPHAEVEH